MKKYYVYIAASISKVVYVGVTNNIEARMYQHRTGVGSTFAKKYRVTKLVYLEETSDVEAAITREKQIKSWSRSKKIALIESQNPNWEDLLR